MLILMEATGQVCVDCERPFDDREMARMCRHTGGLACDDREACERRMEQAPRRDEWVEMIEVRTVLSFWDRTVDRRGGSHSTFVLPPDLDFAAAWQRLDASGVVVRLDEERFGGMRDRRGL